MPDYVSDGGEWKLVQKVPEPKKVEVKPEPVLEPVVETVLDQGDKVPAVNKPIVEPVSIKPKKRGRPAKSK